LREMHLTVAQAQSAFEPESGAYGDHSAHQHADKGHTQNHNHNHNHNHSHSHGHGHDDGHLHDNGHAHG
jgi:urease accessory protein